jgi:hypothetical protein
VSFDPFSQGPALRATTGLAGFAMVNGTPVILSWTAPNDGNLHRFIIYARLIITVATTGGQVFALVQNVSLPGAQNNAGAALFGATGGAGDYFLGKNNQSDFKGILGPGESIQVVQTTALTGGAGVVYAEIWGS